MLANCDKMVLSSITPDEWPELDDETSGGSMVSMSSNGRAMEMMIKPSVQQEQLQQPLKCPRCDSSNTKFCYYNNYSLSQPRHFCKACKRYWTRGGTLRNVPVGGGYRKNKRVKSRPSSASTSSSVGPDSTSITTSSSVVINIPKPNLLVSNISPANDANSIFYGAFPNGQYYHHSDSHMMSPLGINYFPSSTWASSSNAIHQDFGLGFSNPSTANQIQNMVPSSNSILSNFSLLGSSSGLPQQKLVLGGLNSKDDIVGRSFEGLHGMIIKDVKSDESEHQMMSQKMGNWGLANQNNLNIEPDGPPINVNGPVWLNPMSVGSDWPHLTN
ncbi:hypothetical protein Sjap_025739 [Stephania japonica]|uniref:Dof zinc finger protein n=1 Tax=Stephania japonica TaxID=461633 RepID=A0AAP0EA20_9MAGN